MRPERDEETIYASARAIDKALASGASKRTLGVWVQARAAWWGEAAWPDDNDLVTVANDPVVSSMDPMVTAAIKRHLKQ